MIKLAVSTLMFGLICACSGLGLGSASANSQDDIADVQQLANAYLAAVEAMDWARMEELLSPDAVFEDQTAEYFGEPWRYIGAKAIVNFYREGAIDTLSTRYHFVKQYTAGTQSINVIEVSVEVRAGIIGFPQETIKDTTDLVTVLTVKNGRVVRHSDYADYAGMWNKLEGHKRRLQSVQ